ncbi:circadian clock protein KaiC [Chryseolinea sp. H1M3-3]|uniref:circadian clock protein KaiC n=1 Tax=Chryseolinea sp. H1M3-3 TaxID=3034144 RepID=UPI0023ED7AAE|nr:circadian clock protein KaiC [Chryseolinea sp. H1M3-3]
MLKGNKLKAPKFKFPKSPTGIEGLDDITTGGLPKNRPTLLLGNTGCGKTILAMEFIVNGITMFKEPGVFMAFEEKTDELEMNVKSLGYNLKTHLAENKIYLEHVSLSRDEIVETGKYDIEGLFVRLEQAIKKVKAKRVVLDSLDTLFYAFDYKILRSEFKRLFSWLKEKNVTAIITAEIGDAFLTRHGLEEYVADCVIVLDNRVKDQVTTRRLRVVKYRGSEHGNNEYPFVIDEKGVTVFPIIAEPIRSKISSKIISTGIPDLNEMLGKRGYYAGSSVLISGTAGTGKTSIAASFAFDVCKENVQCLYCAFEEAPNQVIRNMRSIGINLEPLVKSGRLLFYSSRPTLQNLELHFISIKNKIKKIKPAAVILDPITNLMTEGPNSGVRLMLTRFVDYLKGEQITVIFTAAITEKLIERNPSDEGISSMVDTWIMVQDAESDGERKRTCTVMKSRGMGHSKMVKHLIISDFGIALKQISERQGKEREASGTSEE